MPKVIISYNVLTTELRMLDLVIQYIRFIVLKALFMKTTYGISMHRNNSRNLFEYYPGPDRECNPLEIVCMNNAMGKYIPACSTSLLPSSCNGDFF